MRLQHLAVAASLALSAGAARADYTLHILHINDLHSRIEPITRSDGTCGEKDAAEGKCFGGVARIAAKVAELRAALAGQNVLLLDAGDQFQGSLMYTRYKGAAEAEFMQTIGFDAMAVGNHEFDDGPAGLAGFLDKVTFPVISTNTDVSREPGLAGRIQPHLVLDVGGQKIGIVSALTTDTSEISSPGPNVTISDEVESLTGAVAALEAAGVSRIIALNHAGLTRDREIAAAVPGLDVVVGGHSHTWLSSSDRAAAGSYPTWVSGQDDALVPVVQAGSYSRYIGHLTVVFNDAGEVMDAWGDTLLLDASVTPDPAISARVAELAGPLEEIKAQVVGELAAPIDGTRENCRQKECEMGNLVADAMLARVKDQGVSIAIQNGGGVRASLDAGPVTMGEVLTVLPFQNTLSVFEVKGEAILAALENGLSQVEEGAGRFPQVAGMKFTWSRTAPAGSRVKSVEVRDGDIWVPIDPAAVYGVVTNNYVRNGGDGYKSFAGDAVKAYDFGPGLDLVLADYLSKAKDLGPYLDGRIVEE